MGRGNVAKVRRHTYSVAELKEKGQELSERINVEGGVWEMWESDADRADVARDHNVNWPISMLRDDARLVGFASLAVSLAQDPRGFCLLTGIERGAAGLEQFRRVGWVDEPSGAFSFCVNDRTYTAFENPDDGYRSSMAWLVERSGNWCSVKFEPCALLPEFRVTEYCKDSSFDTRVAKMPACHPEAGHADMLALLDPTTMEAAVMAGTNRSDEYYPCFVGWHSPEALARAQAAHVAIAYDLDKELPQGSSSKRPKGRL